MLIAILHRAEPPRHIARRDAAWLCAHEQAEDVEPGCLAERGES